MPKEVNHVDIPIQRLMPRKMITCVIPCVSLPFAGLLLSELFVVLLLPFKCRGIGVVVVVEFGCWLLRLFLFLLLLLLLRRVGGDPGGRCCGCDGCGSPSADCTTFSRGVFFLLF